ncbi:MAG: class I SAM-dependent methyltransferase [Methylobacteriaceae bacterium]|nr:class I SAM-dependent methyltransferase [Methylobacteriaceae bacterium]
MAYRLILGREAENDGVVTAHARPERSLSALRDAFLTSEEFRVRVGNLDVGCKPLNWPPIPVEVDVSDHRLEQMIERIEREFKYLGETEPHWSVLSTDRFKSDAIKGHEEEFFASGKGVVDELRAAAARCDVDLGSLDRCFELGCGLGRSTIWLADQFKHVIAADISSTHLALAEQTIRRFGKNNVTLRHVNSVRLFEAETPFDAFFSIIVLQHNPPPLISFILRTVLARLRPGGIAYFQMPTYIVGYKFEVELYLSNRQPPGVPEMHVVPQHMLFKLINDCDCRLLEIREDPAAGLRAVSSRVFVQKR